MDEKLIKKVQALLAKAERTDNQHESDIFYAKAQELITKHSIDETLLGKDNSVNEVITREVTIGVDTAIHQLYFLVFMHNNVASFKTGHYKNGRYSQDRRMIYGTRSDIEFATMLVTSLMMHCSRMLKLYRDIDPARYGGKSFGHSFRMGYAHRISERLEEMKMRTYESTSTDLVLYDKFKFAKDAMTNAHPDLKDIAVRWSDSSAFGSGTKAANSASLMGDRNNIGTHRNALT